MNPIERKVTARIFGTTCANFRLVEGGTLILYLADHSGSSAGTMWLDCAWRLLDENGIRVGSLDSQDVIIAALEQLIGHAVEQVKVHETTMDVRIDFSGRFSLEGFSHSTEIELWEIRGQDGYRFGVCERLELFESNDAPNGARPAET
jgi:hypothetical protein